MPIVLPRIVDNREARPARREWFQQAVLKIALTLLNGSKQEKKKSKSRAQGVPCIYDDPHGK